MAKLCRSVCGLVRWSRPVCWMYFSSMRPTLRVVSRRPKRLMKRGAAAPFDCIYLDPKEQEERYKEVSDLIGWNCIQRRNIGFLEAYRLGAEIVASVDDDNIPYPDWGKHVYVDRVVEVDLYEPAGEVFDPLSATAANHLWHRGFPIELLGQKNQVKFLGKVERRPRVQADLWKLCVPIRAF